MKWQLALAMALGLTFGVGGKIFTSPKAVDPRYRALLVESRAAPGGEAHTAWKNRDIPRLIELLAQPPGTILEELKHLSAKAYVSKDDVELVELLLNKLVAEDPAAALKWFSEQRGYRFGQGVMDLIVKNCLGEVSSYEQVAELAGSLPLQARLTLLHTIGRNLPESAAQLHFIASLPSNLATKLWQNDSRSFFRMISADPAVGFQTVTAMATGAEKSPLLTSYLNFLFETDPEKALPYLVQEGGTLGQSYFYNLTVKALQKIDLKTQLPTALKLAGMIGNTMMRGKQLEEIGLKAGSAGLNFDAFNAGLSQMNETDRASALLGFVTATGKQDLQQGLANLQHLGSSGEAGKALEAIFKEHASSDPLASITAAQQMEGVADRELATKTVIQTWAGKQPEEALIAALKSTPEEKAFLVESWVDGVKTAQAPERTQAEMASAFQEMVTSYSKSDREIVVNALRKKLSKAELEQLPGFVRSYLNP